MRKAHAVLMQLLRISLLVSLYEVRVQGDSLVGTISQDFERLKGALITSMVESEALSEDQRGVSKSQ